MFGYYGYLKYYGYQKLNTFMLLPLYKGIDSLSTLSISRDLEQEGLYTTHHTRRDNFIQQLLSNSCTNNTIISAWFTLV